MIVAYRFQTRWGLAEVALQSDGRWQVAFQAEPLGSFALVAQAVEALASGRCAWPSAGDPSRLGISPDVLDWQAVIRGR